MKSTVTISLAILLIVGLLGLQNCCSDTSINAHADSLRYVYTPYKKLIPDLYIGSLYRASNSPADNPMSYEGVALGRYLFYDSTLSSTHALSCGSCHKQQFAFGDNTPLSTNVSGPTKRNTPPLINMEMNPKFFWDGRATTIEAAVTDAITNEQHFSFAPSMPYLMSVPLYDSLFHKAFGRGVITEDMVHKAIAQFVRTLVAVHSSYDKYITGQGGVQSPAEQAGEMVFRSNTTGDCFHCHQDGGYITFAAQAPNVIFSNNGLDSAVYYGDFKDAGRGKISNDSVDMGKFKVPTLRNIAFTAPYMHDGRFATLDQVINFYSDSLHHSPTISPNMTHLAAGGAHLNATDRANLIAFIHSLEDTTYLHNSEFSNPFHH